MSCRFADSLRASSQHNLYDLYPLLHVQYWNPDDGHRNCPKHVESYSESKFEKLMLLVCFIIRIYDDARSSECRKQDSYRLTKENSVAMIFDRYTESKWTLYRSSSYYPLLYGRRESA